MKTFKYAAALLAFLLGVWILGTSPSFEACKVEQATAYMQRKQSPPPLVSFTDTAAICLRCAGLVINEYRDAVTAISTAMIAAFTYTLFAATKGLVQAARIQSDDMKRSIVASEHSATAAAAQAEIAKKALTDIERPYLFIFNISMLETQEFYDFDEGEVGHTLKVTYDVANHGKIPAIIEVVQENLSVFTDPLSPIAADFDHPLIVAPVLAAGEKRGDCKVDIGWENFGTNEHGNDVPEFGQHTLFLRVVIGYRGPFSRGHETSIGLRYDERTHRFVEYFGGEKYNYQT